jgi:two-component system OmpR family sensor kinase
MSIRTKLILWYSGLLAAIIIMFGVAVYGVTRMALLSTIDNTLETTIEQVLENSRASAIGQFGPPGQVTVALPQLDAFALSGVLVQVWDLSGRPSLITASSNIDDYRQPLDEAALRLALPPDAPRSIYSTIYKNKSEWRVLTHTLDIWGLRIAFQVSTSSQAIAQASKVLVVIMAGAGALGILASVALGFWLSSRALKPINKITGAAARIAAADDLKTRLAWSGPMDELGRLTSVFNQMMQRLEHLFSVQQRFVADVSHELRTPLTAIRGNLDIIKRYGMDKDSFEAIESEVDRMSRLVADLLLLARADYGGLKLELEPLDVDTIVSEVYREARVLAKNQNIKVQIIDFEPVRVNGNADRIKQLLLNLVSNALKFTPENGTITLNLRLEDYDCVLEVKDSGIGISPEDQQRIFDRFYQADASRARSTGEGAGLGLSIAKWIVDAHHGTIGVESQLGEGTTFIIKIPALVERPSVSTVAVTRPRLGIIRRPVTGLQRSISKPKA